MVGKFAYRLELPARMNIHPVFHVYLEKPYTATGDLYSQLPPEPLSVASQQEFEVDHILHQRIWAGASAW